MFSFLSLELVAGLVTRMNNEYVSESTKSRLTCWMKWSHYESPPQNRTHALVTYSQTPLVN